MELSIKGFFFNVIELIMLKELDSLHTLKILLSVILLSNLLSEFYRNCTSIHHHPLRNHNFHKATVQNR